MFEILKIALIIYLFVFAIYKNKTDMFFQY